MSEHHAANCGGPDTCQNPLAHPALTDSWAVPKCRENRAENAQAPYCVSAYCPRCQSLRYARGVPIIIPNAWLLGAQGADYAQGLAQRISDSGR